MEKFIHKGESHHIAELPEYKALNIPHILKDVFQKVWEFINRAGTIIY